MTTAVMHNGTMVVGERPRRSLEELVDLVMDALFASNREQSTAQSVAKSVHDARRLRKTGNLDGALTLIADLDTATADAREARWAFAEWQDLVRRRFGQSEILVYSQGALGLRRQEPSHGSRAAALPGSGLQRLRRRAGLSRQPRVPRRGRADTRLLL